MVMMAPGGVSPPPPHKLPHHPKGSCSLPPAPAPAPPPPATPRAAAGAASEHACCAACDAAGDPGDPAGDGAGGYGYGCVGVGQDDSLAGGQAADDLGVDSTDRADGDELSLGGGAVQDEHVVDGSAVVDRRGRDSESVNGLRGGDDDRCLDAVPQGGGVRDEGELHVVGGAGAAGGGRRDVGDGGCQRGS